MTVHKEPEEDLVILLRENIKHLLHEHVLIEMMTLWFSQLYNYCTYVLYSTVVHHLARSRTRPKNSKRY